MKRFLIDLDILNGWSERERFALFCLNMYVLDNQSVCLAEERTFRSTHRDITQRHILYLHLRQTVEIDGAFDI